jgi:hypothetical protein
MIKVRVLAAAAAVLLQVGCSSATQTSPSRGQGNVVTREQLAATNSENLYEALEKLRPEWLNSRGPTSVTDATPTMPNVFMNGQLLGRAEFMREIRVLDITEARFWPAGQAAARFGMGHPRGVIELTRR